MHDNFSTTQEVKLTGDVEKEPEVNSSTSFFDDGEVIDKKGLSKLKDIKVLPCFTDIEIKKYRKDVNADEVRASGIDSIDTHNLVLASSKLATKGAFGYRETFDFTETDITTNPKYIAMNKRARTSKSALLKLAKRSKIGSHIHVPLYHSGFWLTIEPLDNEEIINLELDIVNDFNRIGKDTSTLAFSHFEVLFVEAIVRNIRHKILESTLKLLDGDDYFNYIDLRDMEVIATSVAASIFPHGINIVYPCSNSISLDENSKPKCNNKIYKLTDILSLIRRDDRKLTQLHKDQMAKKAPRSLTVENVIEYQTTLEDVDDVLEVKDEDGEITLIKINHTTVNRYIESGNLFINNLRDKAIELVKINSDISDEATAENLIINTIYLQAFSHMIEWIKIDEGVITDVNEIEEALSMLSSDEVQTTYIVDHINKFIDDSRITIVGIANYTCKECKTKQSEQSIIPLSLIPISVYEHFFTLLHSKYEKIVKQLERLKER